MAKTGRGKEKNATKAQAEAAEVQVPKAQQTFGMIPQKTLMALLKADDKYKQDIDGLTGELREAIGNAKDKKQLNTKAYALLKRFHREKSNEKLANLWDTLLAYMDMAGVMKRIESVPQLPIGAEDGAEAGEEVEAVGADEEEEGEDAEVVKPQFGGAARGRTEATH